MTPESMADVTVRDGSDFEAILLRAWQGEIYGVHVYGALAESRSNPTESQKLFELVGLEQSMRDQLALVLDALKVPPTSETCWKLLSMTSRSSVHPRGRS